MTTEASRERQGTSECPSECFSELERFWLQEERVIEQVKTGDSFGELTLFTLRWLVEGESGKVGEGVLQVGHVQFVGTGPATKPERLR